MKDVLLRPHYVHPRILRYYGVNWDRANLSAVVFTEWMDGSLKDRLNVGEPGLGEQYLQRCCLQITEGLAFLHRMCIVNCSISPFSILLSEEGDAKIAVFRLSKVVLRRDLKAGTPSSKQGSDDFEERQVAGTPGFLAPEVLAGDAAGFKADVWSLGATLAYLAKNPSEELWAGLAPDWDSWSPGAEYSTEFLEYLSDLPFTGPAAMFIQRCLEPNALLRPSAEELLNDPWLRDAEAKAHALSAIGQLCMEALRNRGSVASAWRQVYPRAGMPGMRKVFEVVLSNGLRVAAKEIKLPNRNPEHVAEVQKEAWLMERFPHPRLVRYYHVHIDPEQCLGLIFMEWMPGGTLEDAASRWKGCEDPDAILRYYCLQIAEGLAYLHGQGIIHRDIKPANVLLTHDGTAKIADLGLSRMDAQPRAVAVPNTPFDGLTAGCGTAGYMAPEIVKQDEQYTVKIDIWSLGATLRVLSWRMGAPRGLASLPDDCHASTTAVLRLSGCERFIARCLQPDPILRPSIAELLQDIWLRKASYPHGILCRFPRSADDRHRAQDAQ